MCFARQQQNIRSGFLLLLSGLLGAVAQPVALPWAGRDALRAAQGTAKPIAEELLQAAESRDSVRIRASITKAIQLGHWELAALMVNYPFDSAKREAAKALAALKGAAVARALLDGLDLLDYAEMGGDQERLLREETRSIFEASLTHITGVKLESRWTKEQKRKAFAGWIAANETRPTPPNGRRP